MNLGRRRYGFLLPLYILPIQATHRRGESTDFNHCIRKEQQKRTRHRSDLKFGFKVVRRGLESDAGV